MSETLRDRLKISLEASGLKASTVCDVAGVDKDTIRNILRGRSKSPSGESIARIAQALNTTAEYLYGLSDEPTDTMFGLRDRDPLDTALLTEVVYSVQSWLEQEKLSLEAHHFAALVSRLYDYFQGMQSDTDTLQINGELPLGDLTNWLRGRGDNSPTG
ncbi:helix-turn-helix domain-containing protein [Coralliovum pocilloporae]|uniref:helix-turn-helix domain-containing protein n=1 Tax=Coralliovum pocilloporae TaxID=3066369 RepID=UPI003306E395